LVAVPSIPTVTVRSCGSIKFPALLGARPVRLPKTVMDIAELSMLLESMDPREVPEEELMEAAGKVKSMKGLPQEQQLMLYGLFKQYTVGDNTSPKPDEADIVNKYKWYADEAN
jgi:hypothetical protein